jgi:hypothetical protein
MRTVADDAPNETQRRHQLFERSLNDILTDSEIDLKVIHVYDGLGDMGDSPMYGSFIFLANTDVRVGEISLRFVNTHTVVNYDSNVGYGVNQKYRGNHYARKSCLKLRDLALTHGLKQLYPTIVASVRTCPLLGAMDLGQIDLPDDFRETHEINETQYRQMMWLIE